MAGISSRSSDRKKPKKYHKKPKNTEKNRKIPKKTEKNPKKTERYLKFQTWDWFFSAFFGFFWVATPPNINLPHISNSYHFSISRSEYNSNLAGICLNFFLSLSIYTLESQSNCSLFQQHSCTLKLFSATTNGNGTGAVTVTLTPSTTAVDPCSAVDVLVVLRLAVKTTSLQPTPTLLSLPRPTINLDLKKRFVV